MVQENRVIPQFWLSENFGCRAFNSWLGTGTSTPSYGGERTPGDEHRHLCASSWITHARSCNKSEFVDELLNKSSELPGCGFFHAAFPLTGPNTKQIQASFWWDQESCEARMYGRSLVQRSANAVLPVRYRRGQVPEWAEEGKKTEKKKSHELRKLDGFISGWWFGTFFIFPYIGNNHPNWRSYFSEGWPNHQPDLIFTWNLFSWSIQWLSGFAKEKSQRRTWRRWGFRFACSKMGRNFVNLRSLAKYFLGIRILMEEYTMQLKLIFLGVRPWTLELWWSQKFEIQATSDSIYGMTNRMAGQPHLRHPDIFQENPTRLAPVFSCQASKRRRQAAAVILESKVTLGSVRSRRCRRFYTGFSGVWSEKNWPKSCHQGCPYLSVEGFVHPSVHLSTCPRYHRYLI